MKSTLTYAILHGNARHRHAKCLYVSLEQTRPSLERQMASMGFDVEAVRGDLHIVDVGTIQKEVGKGSTKPWMEFLRRTLTTKKDIDGVDLLVIDSLEALEVLAKFEDRRTEHPRWERSASVEPSGRAAARDGRRGFHRHPRRSPEEPQTTRKVVSDGSQRPRTRRSDRVGGRGPLGCDCCRDESNPCEGTGARPPIQAVRPRAGP